MLHVEVGNKTIKGSLLRSIFGLKSSNFTITVDSQNVTFEVRGSGHGVGMSQHGANEMANEGSSYQEILAWYYQGTQISYWGRED